MQDLANAESLAQGPQKGTHHKLGGPEQSLPPRLPLVHKSPVHQSCARHGVMQSGRKLQSVVAYLSWELRAASSPGNWSTARASLTVSSSCVGVEQRKDRMCTGALA